MNKLIGGLALSFLMGLAQSTLAQEDPFAIPSPEPTPEESRSLYLEIPPAQAEEPQPEPIIEALPIEKVKDAEKVDRPVTRISQRPVVNGSLTSRPQNAHVRQTRTAAQEYIYQRAVYRAKQRTNRIEQRTWRGESILRPTARRQDLSWYHQTSLPTWGADFTRIR